MPRSSRNGKSKLGRKLVVHQNEQWKGDKVKKLLLPTYPDQFGNTGLANGDFNGRLYRQISPFSTMGTQNFFLRSVYELGNITQQAISDTAMSYRFRLSDVPGYGDSTALFDQYRLRAVSVAISPQYTSQAIMPSSSGYNPKLYTAIDYDDIATTTRAQILQYDSCVVAPPGCGIIRSFIPQLSVVAYQTSVGNAYTPKDLQWVDAAYPTVEHYGLKVVVEGGASGQTALQSYNVVVTAFWQFKSSR